RAAVLTQPPGDGSDRDLCRLTDRVTIDSRADGRKAHALYIALGRQSKACFVAGLQCFGLAVVAAAVAWTYCMEDVFRGQAASSGDHSTSGRAAAFFLPYRIELAHDLRAARAVNCPVDTAASRQL